MIGTLTFYLQAGTVFHKLNQFLIAIVTAVKIRILLHQIIPQFAQIHPSVLVCLGIHQINQEIMNFVNTGNGGNLRLLLQ